MTKHEILKQRRAACAAIPTDADGNIIKHNPLKQSGTKWRAEHRKGVFYKKDENHRNSRNYGTYTQYSSVPVPTKLQTDEQVADADERVVEGGG